MAADQRYCLECGERRAGVSDFLRSGPAKQAPPPTPPGYGPPRGSPPAPAPRSNTVSLLAGIGVLLLAMGVGVLIGRSGSGQGQGKTPAPQVIQVGGAGTSEGTSSEQSFTGDWPAGKKGWTVELQTLPVSSTVAAVEAAKTAAKGRGASTVGALKAEEFPSVGGEGYVVYSGEYTKKSEASKALSALKKSFPGAKVVEVSAAGAGAEPGSTRGAASKSKGGSKPSVESSLTKPAKLKGASGAHKTSGKKYVEESAKLPNVVETG